jgi:hypothetical protein
MFGWDRNTRSEGYSSGTHDYFIEDEFGQAALTDSAFALLEGDSEPHPTRADRALVEFGVVLGLYLSALERRRIALPLDPPDGCAFSPRCRYAEAVCYREPGPLLETRPDGHSVRCWRADEIAGQTALPSTESR